MTLLVRSTSTHEIPGRFAPFLVRKEEPIGIQILCSIRFNKDFIDYV